MHRRLPVAVSALICALAVFLAWVLCDLHDRSLPQELHPSAVVSLNFSDSGPDDVTVFRQLARMNSDLGLGLVRILPDMENGTDVQVFAPLPGTTLPGTAPTDTVNAAAGATVRRFGDLPDGRIASADRLDSASAGGQYLVCGRWDDASRAALNQWAAGIGARIDVGEDDLAGGLRMLLGQSSFRVAMGSAIALMVVLVLFWLSFEARSRALRVMAGVPGWKIQYDDAAGLLLPMMAVAVPLDAAAAVAVLALRGTVFVPYLMRVTLLFEAVAFASLLLAVVAVSAAAWPSAHMITDRMPMPRGLLRAATLVKAVVFVAVLAAIAPSIVSFQSASDAAREQAVWRRLRDQVSVSVTFGPDQSNLDAKAAALVHAMERRGRATMSYTFANDGGENGAGGGTDDRAGNDVTVGLVTRSWLNLVGVDPDATPGIRALDADRLPDAAREVVDQFAAWTGDDAQTARLADQSRYFEADDITVPLLKGGSDEMLFPKRTTIIVVPDLGAFSDTGFLVPALSSRNIVLTGLEETRAEATRQGLGDAVSVRYVAEDQILRAQFSTYFAWMQAAAIALLFAAFAVVTLVGADIRATLRAGHDYPLLLAGYAPGKLAASTVLVESLFGLVAASVICILLTVQRTAGIPATTLAALGAIAFSACCHRTAVAGAFRAVNNRTL